MARLIAIMDEVDLATVRTSFSTIVGESRDFACIMTDSNGASLCQSSFSPPNFCVSACLGRRVTCWLAFL